MGYLIYRWVSCAKMVLPGKSLRLSSLSDPFEYCGFCCRGRLLCGRFGLASDTGARRQLPVYVAPLDKKYSRVSHGKGYPQFAGRTHRDADSACRKIRDHFRKYRIDARAKRLEGWQNFITYEVKRPYRQAGSA